MRGMDEISTGITAFKAMIEALRGMLALGKEVKDALPEGPKKVAFERALQEFDASAATVKLELAKKWGYPLCNCTFPPQIMLRTGRDAYNGSRWNVYTCPGCKLEERDYL